MNIKKYRTAAIGYTVFSLIWAVNIITDIIRGELLTWMGGLHVLCFGLFVFFAIMMWRKWKEVNKK